MKKIKRLNWDSDFFGRETGKMNVDGSWPDSDSLHHYELVYLYSNSKVPDEVICSYLKEFEIFEAGPQLKFGKEVTNAPTPEGIRIAKANEIHHTELQELALSSGVYSRFRLDPHMESGKFRELYLLWLENSLKKILADETYVITVNDETAGFISLRSQNTNTVIGLIAVSKRFQGQGLGTQLLQQAESHAKKEGMKYLFVSTQFQNSAAVALYEKYGFKLKEESYLYHLWKKKQP